VFVGNDGYLDVLEIAAYGDEFDDAATEFTLEGRI